MLLDNSITYKLLIPRAVLHLSAADGDHFSCFADSDTSWKICHRVALRLVSILAYQSLTTFWTDVVSVIACKHAHDYRAD